MSDSEVVLVATWECKACTYSNSMYYESSISASSQLQCDICAYLSPLSSLRTTERELSCMNDNTLNAKSKGGRIPSKQYIGIGSTVNIILKCDQPTGKLTRGIVKRHLTNHNYHPHGIKVELINGEVGRVQSLG